MNEFNLQAIVRDVLDEGGCDTFRQYAARVIGRIPPKELKNVLMATLPEYVRNVDHKSKPVVLQRTGHASSRVQAIAEAWALFLARHITTDAGTQIRLADATELQVRFYVGLLRVKASEVNDRADAFEGIADQMKASGAVRVKDLPSDIGTKIIRAAA